MNLSKYLLVFGLLITASITTYAAPNQVLTLDNKLDVGNANLLSKQIDGLCSQQFNQPGKAFQCRSACGMLGRKVEGLATHINRKNAPPRVITGGAKAIIKQTKQCEFVWRGRPTPPELEPFKELAAYLRKGQLPGTGAPSQATKAHPSRYAVQLAKLAPQLAALGNICRDSLFKDNCQKSCSLQADTKLLAQFTKENSLASLDKLNKVSGWVNQLHRQSIKVTKKASECARHFGRNPVSQLVTIQTISKDILGKTQQVFQRQQQAEKLAREQEKRRIEEKQRAERLARQQAYDKDLAQLRSCRKDSPFRRSNGCSYLTAVYDGDFKRATQIEYQSTLPYRAGWMGDSYKEMGKMFGSLYGGEDKFNQDFENMWKAYSFIGRLLGTYATYYQHYYPQCMGENPAVVTLTTDRQREYRNGFGTLVRTERLPSKIDVITIPRRLYPYVNFSDINKDGQAQLQLVDMLAGEVNKFPRIKLFDVTMGLSNTMKKLACDSVELQTLEKQMLSYQRHRKTL